MHDDGPDAETSIDPRRHGHVPRKRLGQNFLRDRSVLSRIVAAAEVEPDDDVLEIGAGTGVLTRALLHAARRVVAIELDDSLISLLRAELGATPHLHLWHGNALDFSPEACFTGPYKLLGNIPYYITGPLVRRYLEISPQPQVLVFMVQWEVAQRIVALPGRLSVLGVSVQYYAAAEVVARVPARAFFPVPRVDSAILKLVPKTGSSRVSAEAFFPVVRAGFSMKRKQIANSLSSGLSIPREQAQHYLQAAGIDDTRRAETLSIPEWETLASVVSAATRVESP